MLKANQTECVESSELFASGDAFRHSTLALLSAMQEQASNRRERAGDDPPHDSCIKSLALTSAVDDVTAQCQLQEQDRMQGEQLLLSHAQNSYHASPRDGARRISRSAEDTWCAIESALAPVIGERAVCALFKRSLHLRRHDYPWLAAAYAHATDYSSFTALQEATLQQPEAIATAANSALLETLERLLDRLIGESLTQRLLVPVLINSAGISSV